MNRPQLIIDFKYIDLDFSANQELIDRIQLTTENESLENASPGTFKLHGKSLTASINLVILECDIDQSSIQIEKLNPRIIIKDLTKAKVYECVQDWLEKVNL